MRKIVRPTPLEQHCACGCGQVTSVWRGQHRKYITGHHARGRHNARYGVKLSDATRQKIADGRKGITTRSAGWKHTADARSKMAEAHAKTGYAPRRPGTGWTIPCRNCGKPVYVVPHNADSKFYCSLSCSSAKPGALNNFFGRRHSDETKEKIRQATIRQRATKVSLPTKPEQLVHAVLRHLGLAFETEVPLGRWCVDVFVPELSLVIFVDGCYWHACPKHFPNKKKHTPDRGRVPYLTKMGMHVLVVWEHDVLENAWLTVTGAIDSLRNKQGYCA